MRHAPCRRDMRRYVRCRLLVQGLYHPVSIIITPSLYTHLLTDTDSPSTHILSGARTPPSPHHIAAANDTCIEWGHYSTPHHIAAANDTYFEWSHDPTPYHIAAVNDKCIEWGQDTPHPPTILQHPTTRVLSGASTPPPTILQQPTTHILSVNDQLNAALTSAYDALSSLH